MIYTFAGGLLTVGESLAQWLLFRASDYPFRILDLRLLITPFGILDLRFLITPFDF
jgi:hypothetical protein